MVVSKKRIAKREQSGGATSARAVAPTEPLAVANSRAPGAPSRQAAAP
jgi:hypothetical protein